MSDGINGTPINLEVALFEWGQIREPYRGYYGQISAEDIASWRNQHHHRLFAPNFRVFLGATDVNQNMVDTLTQRPENLWYFNNGITAICRSIEKKILGGQSRDTGIFECKDLTIVNGAQTVGAISAAIVKNLEQARKARVTIRLISLDECPPDFDKEVTRYTNTQNRIESRDFVALDPNQERIRSELLIDGIEYVYKSGETPSSRDKGFDLTEATVALACKHSDPSFAVDAKGAVGRLWADIETAPYKSLFNDGLTGPRLWRLVQITRVIESILEPIRQGEQGRKRLLAMQGNRLCIHAVFSRLSEEQISMEKVIHDIKGVLETTTLASFNLLYSIIEEHYSDNYLGSLFKNKTKSQDVMHRFKVEVNSTRQTQ
ncbi:AIPR family protein [Acaryochloris sp. IP29b_bin.137]|uniref:AIPR family protein n=1 Tax=Acaryochloris sp. IP29b_bin.137 TaxID=2969217 RepID=UPI002624DEEA|nr:AIPR family protein [Acaryochloris sp. IP29b_bin.137]